MKQFTFVHQDKDHDDIHIYAANKEAAITKLNHLVTHPGKWRYTSNNVPLNTERYSVAQ